MRPRPFLLVATAVAVLVALVAAPEPRALVRRLGDASARERDAAARELLALGFDAASALEDGAADADPEVRARSLALLDLVAEGDGPRSPARVREAEALAVQAMRDASALAEGSSIDVRLRDLGDDGSRALADATARRAERGFLGEDLALALVRHASAPTLRVLAESLRDGRAFPSAVLAAAWKLADASTRDSAASRIDASAALAAAAQALASDDAPVRRAAVALCAAIAGEGAAPRLAAMAGDVDASVRAETARALGRVAPARSASVLRRLAADSYAVVREAALDALARVPGIPHPDAAVACAADAVPAVRAAAARLLARDATQDTRGVLDALAADRSPRVRAAAQRAIAGLR